jgi:hypothetical protein
LCDVASIYLHNARACVGRDTLLIDAIVSRNWPLFTSLMFGWFVNLTRSAL